MDGRQGDGGRSGTPRPLWMRVLAWAAAVAFVGAVAVVAVAAGAAGIMAAMLLALVGGLASDGK